MQKFIRPTYFSNNLIFFDFSTVLILSLRQFFITYQERLRDWPAEALTTSFTLLISVTCEKRCQFHFRLCGADKSDEKLITLKLVI